MLLVLLFTLISAVALFSIVNELEFKHVVGIFLLGVAFIGINNIIFNEMKDKINQVQRTISLLASMIDAGEQNSIQSRSDTLKALITLEEIKNGLNTKENELPPPRGH